MYFAVCPSKEAACKAARGIHGQQNQLCVIPELSPCLVAACKQNQCKTWGRGICPAPMWWDLLGSYLLFSQNNTKNKTFKQDACGYGLRRQKTELNQIEAQVPQHCKISPSQRRLSPVPNTASHFKYQRINCREPVIHEIAPREILCDVYVCHTSERSAGLIDEPEGVWHQVGY